MENLDAPLNTLTAKRSSSNVTVLHSRKAIEQAFLEVFEIIGGVPRLALWANDDKNYEKFLDLLMKLAPKGVADKLDQGATITYISNVPQSPLNRVDDAGH